MSRSDDPLSAGHRRAVSASVRLYRKLLFVYPEGLREEYAGEMVRYFGELCEEALRRGGVLALVVTWLRTLYELAVSAKVERSRTIPQRDTHPGTAVVATLCCCPGAGQAYNGQWVKSALHALAFLASFLVPLVWFPAGGLTMSGLYVLLLVAGVVGYSTLDAWVTARRIEAAQRANS